MPAKLPWRGVLVGVQPRIRLNRSFDQRSHSYLGFALRLEGALDDDEGEFLIGIGKAAQAKHAFRYGDHVSGLCEPVADPRLEPVEFYRTSKLALLDRVEPQGAPGPPWHGPPPELPVYRERGHRRLAARTFDSACTSCIWGCRMAVEMVIDHWNPDRRRYRTETFCYGPKSCPVYKPGPTRKVPGRNGMSWEEEDWIDEEATGHRGPEE